MMETDDKHFYVCMLEIKLFFDFSRVFGCESLRDCTTALIGL